MYKVIFFNDAKLDYIQIWKYIAQENLFYANEVLDKIDKSIDTICLFPLIWTDIGNNIRSIVEPKYKFKIVYEVRWDIIYIYSIFKYKNLWE